MEKVKVSELRKGNIINGVYQLEESNGMHYTICKFLGYHPFDNYIYVESKDGIEEFIQFNPVILDEEILLKCGYEIANKRDTFISFNGSPFVYLLENGNVSMSTGIEMEYLHQLQNRVFSLTGQELNTSLL